MWLLLAFLACSNRTPPPAPTPDPATVVAPEPAAPADPSLVADPACIEACKHDNMARPVAGEVIEADCRAACTPQAIVQGAPDLALRLGQRVVAVGTYKSTLHHGHGAEPYMGTAVVLADGTPLWISTGGGPAELEKWLDQAVRIEGTLAPGTMGDPGIWLANLGAAKAP